jgi:NADH dehydrogenase
MKIVIVGGGFGGLRLARRLNNKKGFKVVLIDRFNHHQFQPLFYQVATSGLDASNISFPLRKVFQNSRNVRFRLTEVEEVKPHENKLITDQEEISYDKLILATGATTNFFGNPDTTANAIPMKSTVEALQLRYRLLQNFEDATTTRSEEDLKRLMNIVVVGGGPTGVELAGALGEMKKYVLPKDYPELDFSAMNIYLLEGSSRTLGSMSDKSSNQSKKYLQKLGVQVMTDVLVENYDGKNVLLRDGAVIASSIVIWAAGIKGNIPAGINNNLITVGNRIRIDNHCRVPGFENMYAIGDLAYLETNHFKKGLPQVAPVAIQQANLLAYNFIQEQKNRPQREFHYRDKGSMATVGRHLAVVDIPRPRLHFGGFIAWVIWMALHLMLILGVKNRFFVFCNWLYSYTTYDQSLRLIFNNGKK